MRDIALAAHRKTYVRPVEGANENARLRRKKLLHDVGPGRRIRRRGHGDELHLPFARDGSRDLGEIGVFGPEIMAPLRDAMRLVDGQNIGPRRAQQRLRVSAHEPLGCDIKETIAALPQALLDRGVIARAVDGIQSGRRDAARAQLLHLIAHQGDQRRDDDGEARAHDGWKLITKRLAGAGRHHGEDVLAVENGLKHFQLPRPEVGKAETALQRRAGVNHVVEQEAPPGSRQISRTKRIETPGAIACLRPVSAGMANKKSRRARKSPVAARPGSPPA